MDVKIESWLEGFSFAVNNLDADSRGSVMDFFVGDLPQGIEVKDLIEVLEDNDEGNCLEIHIAEGSVEGFKQILRVHDLQAEGEL